MVILQKILKSKTLMFSLLLAVLGVVEVSFGIFQNYLSPAVYGFSLMLISIIVAVLRVLTTLPLDEK